MWRQVAVVADVFHTPAAPEIGGGQAAPIALRMRLGGGVPKVGKWGRTGGISIASPARNPAERRSRMARVLFIVSGATYWVLKDGTRYATGYWAEEFANPYKILTDEGHDVVVATPNGVTPNVDMMSLRPAMAGGVDGALRLEEIIRSAEVMRRPLQLSDVRLEDYDAVYLPGGHGPMSDLAWDADVGRLLTAQLASGRPLFIVCHAPSAILATRIHGVSPFRDYDVTCFTNEEEEAVGLASRAPWLLETELKDKVGVNFSRGPIWEPYMVEDRNLVTGQNPHSAAVLGGRLLEVLK
jgi:putative intracellular protease/amidase